MARVRIACLHTAHSNIAVFDSAGVEMGLHADVLSHTVDPELLAATERAGYLPPDIADRTRAMLVALLEDADVVLLTCSTLGPVIDRLGPALQRRVLRVDAELARLAVTQGGRVAVLCAAQTTLDSTTALFDMAARHTGAVVKVEVVPQAWERFKQGDQGGYASLIVAAAQAAYAAGADVVALAQSSMAPAAQMVLTAGRVPSIKPGTLLTSPGAGLAAAIKAAS